MSSEAFEGEREERGAGLESSLARELISAHPMRAAAVLERLGLSATIGFLRRLSAMELARIIPSLSPHFATRAIESLSIEQITEMVEELPSDIQPRVARLLGARAEAVLEALPAGLGRALGTILRFPPDSAGGLMDSRVLALPFDMTAGDAVARVRELSENARYNLYVVDREQRLLGVLTLRELLLASPASRLSDLMVRNPHRLNASTSRANIIMHPGWREVHAIPVVDDQNRYLGAIRYRTLRSLEDELRPRDGDATVEALGEILAVGANGMLRALTTQTPGTGD